MGGAVLTVNAHESITITTYYPSPYGSYNELQTNKLAVGDTNGSGGLDVGDQPPANGQIYTARSVIYKPQSSLPAINAREGELVYNNSDNKFYYYDGLNWSELGRGSITTVIETTCYRGSRVDLYATCPSNYRLIGCSGGPGDVDEIEESEHIIPEFDNNRCYLRVLKPRCFSNESVQMIIAICER